MTQGQDGYATPFLYDSFIRDSTPVYPDAPKNLQTPSDLQKHLQNDSGVTPPPNN
jgi:hypothetical protein